jgi:hypothetical protein
VGATLRRTRSGQGSGPPDSITESKCETRKTKLENGAGTGRAGGSLFSCLLVAGRWSLITLSARVAHPCGFSLRMGGSWGSLFLLRGSELQLRHTSTPKNKDSPNSFFPPGVRRFSPFRSGKELLARKPSLPPGVFVKRVKTKGLRAQLCATA